MICFSNLDLLMCHVFCFFWQPQLLLVMRMSIVRLWCSSFASNIQQLISRQASEAVSACNFLGQPLTLFMCQTSFISARVNKSGPGIGSQ